jgi:hypothetical protein
VRRFTCRNIVVCWWRGYGCIPGGQGVAGSNPAVPTIFRTLVARIGNETRHDRSHLAPGGPGTPPTAATMPPVIALPRSRGPGARHHRAHRSWPAGRTTAAARAQAFSTGRGPGRRDEPTPDRPAPSGPAAPDLHEPRRRRGQPVPHQLPDVHRAAHPRTRQPDAVIPARPSQNFSTPDPPNRHHVRPLLPGAGPTEARRSQ